MAPFLMRLCRAPTIGEDYYPSTHVNQLEFSFQDMLDEIDAVSRVAEDFIAPASRAVLPQLRTTLESIRDTVSDTPCDWGIRESQPLLSEMSRGSYQPDDYGEYNVAAQVTSIWTIQRVRPPGKKTVRAKNFRLAGKASTRLRLFEEAPGGGLGNELGMWRMEIGDTAGPGCCFHVQIMGEAATGPFPRALDVPRLPGLIATPPAVIEYVLAELFQEGWARHVAAQSAYLQRWAPIQRQRLSAVLDWQLEIIRNATGSPWTTLKRAKPAPDLFLRADS